MYGYNHLPTHHHPPSDQRTNPHYRSRAMTNPAESHASSSHSTVAHPSVLIPGKRPSTAHKSDVFFAAPPTAPERPGIHGSSSAVPEASRFPTSANMHTFHRSLTCPPPIPPKPPALPPFPQSIPVPQASDAPQQAIPSPEPPNEEDELALALALSQSENAKHRQLLEKLTNQEEEDLARAMAESLSMAHSSPYSTHAYEGESSSSVIQYPFTKSPVDTLQKYTSPLTVLKDDPIATRDVQVGPSRNRSTSSPAASSSKEITYSDIPSPSTPKYYNQTKEDKGLAQQLAQAEEAENSNSNNSSIRTTPPNTISNDLRSPPSGDQSPTQSNRAFIRFLPESDEDTDNSITPTASTSNSEYLMVDPPAYEVAISPDATLVRDSDSLASTAVVSRHESTDPSSSVQHDPAASQFMTPTTQTLHRANSFSGSSIVEDQRRQLITRSVTANAVPPSSTHVYQEAPVGPSPASLNPYVAAELLKGVTIGFDGPMLSTQLPVMQDAMPSIISLPYGRSLPLHIQAPNWRHMLKLMARLPGTTIQPTIEAMSISKAQFQLRTVVQLVKPHLVSTEWRVILWFTIEHPVPPDVTGNARYTNDVNVLPWSYTFSPAPVLLRDGPDTSLSKRYTIPACPTVPFPTLPITFPDLAMYLHASLEVSRRYLNDSSSGMRKLAKMIDSCYPHTDSGSVGEPERRSMGDLFKRVMGRNNRRRGGNEDTYDLVTPFVADEWG